MQLAEYNSLLFVGTTVSFHAHEDLWRGIYTLTVKISDAQGLSCPDSQKFEVEVCTCEKTGSCGPRLAAQRGFPFKIGAPAIGLILSGAALLLRELSVCVTLLYSCHPYKAYNTNAVLLAFSVVPFLLIFCQCGTVSEFTDLPFDAKECLISYHTEGIGEDKVCTQKLFTQIQI